MDIALNLFYQGCRVWKAHLIAQTGAKIQLEILPIEILIHIQNVHLQARFWRSVFKGRTEADIAHCWPEIITALNSAYIDSRFGE